MNKFNNPLFSRSIIEHLRKMVKDYNNNIAEYLLAADIFWICRDNLYDPIDKDIMEKKLENVITENVSMLSVRENVFEMSFLPKGKDPKYGLPLPSGERTWSKENRQTGKPAKIVKKLISYKGFTDQDYEIFNNQLKVCIENNYVFKLVKGEDIRFWYDQRNYHACTSTLGDSCMKAVNPEFFDIYVDHAELLILLKDNLLVGRALVWTFDDKKFMDRVYYSQDHLHMKFRDYAVENGWYLRSRNNVLNDGNEIEWLSPENNYQVEEFHDLVIDPGFRYRYYPYMDSFRYLYDDDTVTTRCGSYRTELSYTDGGADVESYTCTQCGYSYSTDDYENQDRIVYSNYLDDYLCDQCRVYSDHLGDWIDVEESTTVHISRTSEDWIPNDLNEWDDIIVQIDEEYWFKNSPLVEYNEKEETYYINEQN